MIASVFLLASWLGCIIISIFGMKLGRRVWIIIGNVIQIVGTIVSATSYSAGQLIAGRTLIVRCFLLYWHGTMINKVDLGRWQWLPHVNDSCLCC